MPGLLSLCIWLATRAGTPFPQTRAEIWSVNSKNRMAVAGRDITDEPSPMRASLRRGAREVLRSYPPVGY